MIFVPQKLVHVYYNDAKSESLMGRLLLKDRKIFFEYDADFVKTGQQISPFKLPLRSGIITSNDRVFDGLFGVFNDSLPDGWGRLLLDRKLIKLGLNPGELSPLDRLCFVGSHGMGLLSYEPENSNGEMLLNNQNLDKIYEEIQSFQDDDDEFVDELFSLGGSSGGARPKVLIKLEGEDWLIKFRSSLDPKYIGPIEYAYHLMAIQSGLDVPPAKLFPSKTGPDYFGVKRFDRNHGKRIHMHSISGLLHADHKEPSLDYEMIMKATSFLTHDLRECEKQFRNASFNVLSHNRDDHAKNFSCLMDAEGVWRVSPAYDLVFSSGPSGEHSTMVMGEGKSPKMSHLLALAAIGNIKKSRAIEIIEQVISGVEKWEEYAKIAGVSQIQAKRIQGSLEAVRRSFASSS
jgi:serine/threonine-protein kinase HipA